MSGRKSRVRVALAHAPDGEPPGFCGVCGARRIGPIRRQTVGTGREITYTCGGELRGYSGSAWEPLRPCNAEGVGRVLRVACVEFRGRIGRPGNTDARESLASQLEVLADRFTQAGL